MINHKAVQTKKLFSFRKTNVGPNHYGKESGRAMQSLRHFCPDNYERPELGSNVKLQLMSQSSHDNG